jgi:hypothetical protein
MDFRVIGFEMAWIPQYDDRVRAWIFVNPVMKIKILYRQ